MKTKKMNKVALFSLCAMFAACSEYDPADLSVQYAEKINEYSKNFVARYGEIDPNHTWGFGSVESMSNMSTRAELARKDKDGNNRYAPPTPIDKVGKKDSNGNVIEQSEYDKVQEEFKTAKESDDVYFIWGTYYVQFVSSNIEGTYYFAARNYRNPSEDYSKTSDGKNSGLNSQNTLSEENESLYRDDNKDSFTMFAGMGYDSDDENPQFTCVDENGKIIENCNFIIRKIGTSFYIGFDIDGNGTYNDWIVKIIPAGSANQAVYRIMCEDLGSTSDFDFNDIVFDYDPSEAVGNGQPNADGIYASYDITIMVQAAGGTIPVYIGNTNPLNEVHSILLGRKKQDDILETDCKTPINVQYRGNKSIPAMPKTIKNLTMPNGPDHPEDIPLYRKNTGENAGQSANQTPDNYKIPDNNPGNPPFKICVPAGTQWTKEANNIELAYPLFKKWVSDENGNAGFSGINTWTETDKNVNHLMEPNPEE